MWIIQTDVSGASVGEALSIKELLTEMDVPFQEMTLRFFTDHPDTILDLPDKHVIPYGSTALMKYAEKEQWTGLFFDRQTFRVDRWNQERDDMLNSDARIMTVNDAYYEFTNRDPDEVWFIRPLEDLKQFNGTVTTSREISRWMMSVDSGNFSFGPDTIVCISSPKDVQMEWRYFVVDRKIATGSSYRFKGLRLLRREEDPKVLEEAQTFADEWLPHETCVMDLALVDGEVKVVEFNCLNSSGFYYHDVRAFVRAVNKYFEERVNGRR